MKQANKVSQEGDTVVSVKIPVRIDWALEDFAREHGMQKREVIEMALREMLRMPEEAA